MVTTVLYITVSSNSVVQCHIEPVMVLDLMASEVEVVVSVSHESIVNAMQEGPRIKSPAVARESPYSFLMDLKKKCLDYNKG